MRRLKFTREGKYFVALTFGIGFAAMLLSPLLMLILFALALVPGLNSHLHGCQH